jgi:hypothetical protein
MAVDLLEHVDGVIDRDRCVLTLPGEGAVSIGELTAVRDNTNPTHPMHIL